jgi:hypothetical protein
VESVVGTPVVAGSTAAVPVTAVIHNFSWHPFCRRLMLYVSAVVGVSALSLLAADILYAIIVSVFARVMRHVPADAGVSAVSLLQLIFSTP